MIPSLITENISNNMENWIRPENPILDFRVQNRNRLRYMPVDSVLSGDEKQAIFTACRKYVYFAKKGERTLHGLLNLTVGSLIAHERIWLSFDNRFRLCFADYQTLEMKKYICKWWVKITSTFIITGRTQAVVEMIKSYMLRLKRHFFGFEFLPRNYSDLLKRPERRGCLDGLPRFPKGTWMEKPPSSLSREERSLASSFITTRSLPHADGEKVKESLKKHSAVLHLEAEEVDPVHEDWIRKMARIAAHELYECYTHNHTAQGSHAHISITNSATFEMSRSEGGRAEYVRTRFWDYITSKPQEGDPIFRDCDPTDDEDMDLDETDRAHAYTSLPRLIPLSRNISPNLYPLISYSAVVEKENRAFFDLLILEAFKDLRDSGFIEESGMGFERTEEPFPMNRSAGCEPGGKARIVTQTPAALTTIGQPIQHVLKEVLAADPTLRAGLGAAAQSFELHKRLRFSNPHPKGEMFFGDFEEATDYINWDIFKIIFEEFCIEFEIEEETWLYFYLHELLPSPCVMVDDIDSGPTCRGLLMGLPGTKFALHLINKVLNVFVRGLERPRNLAELLMDPFAAAGDDIFDIDVVRTVRFPFKPDLFLGVVGFDEDEHDWITTPLSVGARYLIGARLLGMKMSDSKSGTFKYGGPYCEVPILDTDFSNAPWDNKGGFQDCLRLRLLSPETKQAKGDQDTSPLIGKAFQFMKELQWQPEIFPNRKLRAYYSFFTSFRKYLGHYDFHMELHPFLGGLGMQMHTDQELYDLVPTWYKRLIAAYLNTYAPELSRKAVRVFHQWNSDRLARGVSIEYDNELEDLLAPFTAWRDVGSAIWDVVKCASEVRKTYEKGKANGTPEQEVHRSMRELATSMIGDDLTPLGRFLPPCPSKDARYIDKVKYLRSFGIYPLKEVVKSISGKDMWDPQVEITRGFTSMTLEEKNSAQLELCSDYFDHIEPVDFPAFQKLLKTLRSKDEFVNTAFIHVNSTRKMWVAEPTERLRRYCRFMLKPAEQGDLGDMFMSPSDRFESSSGYFVDLRSTKTARIEMYMSNQDFLSSRRVIFLSGVPEDSTEDD